MSKKWSKSEIDALVLADRDAVRLNLASKGLKRIPESVFELKKLKRLFLKFNEIELLPWEIGDLENLEVLDLWGNWLAELPRRMEKLTKLTALSLSYNSYLEEIPSFIGSLTRLKALDFMGGPQPKRVAKEIGNLVELQKVGLSTLKGLPKSFFELPKLKTIVLFRDTSGCDDIVQTLKTKMPKVAIANRW